MTTTPRPRVWTALTALVVVLPASIAVQIPIALVLIGLRMSETGEGGEEAAEWLQEYAVSAGGFFIFLVSAQIVYAAFALIPARLSPVPLRERLGLVPGRISFPAMLLVAIGSILLLHAAELAWDVFFDQPSEHLIGLTRAFVETSLPVGLGLAAAASILPGFCEEILCRGYVQRRLLLRFPAPVAIGVTSLAFALMHFDPQHIVSVVPLALWLGYVGWRAASTWPSIMCHVFVNALSFGLLVLAGDEILDSVELRFGGAWFVLSVPTFIAAVFVLERGARPYTRYPE